MDKNRQIEEMAKEICSEYDCVIPCQSCAYYAYANCRDVKSAEKLYIAGYRKASDVSEEIFEQIEKLLTVDRNGEATLDVRDLAELKKKWTEGEG